MSPGRKSTAEHAAEAPRAHRAGAADAPERYAESLLEAIHDGIVLVDGDGRQLSCNAAARRILPRLSGQMTPEQWPSELNMFLADRTTPCPPDRFPLVSLMQSGRTADIELYVCRPDDDDGGGLWVHCSAAQVAPLDAAREQQRFMLVLRDITQHKRVESALEAERRQLQRAYRRQLALAEIELAVSAPHELQTLLDRVVESTEQLVPARRACIVLQEEGAGPRRFSVRSCTTLSSSARAAPSEPDESGATRWIVEHRQPLTVRDIRDDPFPDAPLFGDLEPGSYAGVPLVDHDRVVGVLYALDVAPRQLDQQDLDFMTSLARRAAAAVNKLRVYEKLSELNASLQRKTVELRENEQRFRALADTAPVLIWMIGRDGAATYFNQPWQAFTGRALDDELGDGWLEGVHPEDRRMWREAQLAALQDGGPTRNEFRLRAHDGTYRWMLVTGAPRLGPSDELLGLIGSCVDITDRKEAEGVLTRDRLELKRLVAERTAELEASMERLRDADRLATIGTLTAGLGHDMNNVLFPIRCRLDAIDPATVPAELRELLHAVDASVEYLQQLTDGLRQCASSEHLEQEAMARTDVRHWWEQVNAIMRSSVPPQIEIAVEIEPDLPPIALAPGRLTQAMLNLVANAGEAAPAGSIVRIGAARSDRGDAVAISVSDDGPGMQDEVRRQALDPFFTTKTRTLSTGLGLSLVQGAVTAAGGTVEIDSAPGAGATVTLTIPASTTDRPPSAGRPRAAISLIDPRARAWIRRMLEASGFETVEPGDEDLCGTSLWMVDADPAHLPAARRYVENMPDRRVIVLGAAEHAWHELGAIIVEQPGALEAIRAAIRGAAQSTGGSS